MTRAITGVWVLIASGVRRERFRIVTYVAGLALLQWAMLAATELGEPEALVEETASFAASPALRMFGIASGASVGATMSIRGYFLLAVLAALGSALAVVRLTRQDEELGRAELVGAAVVGRHATLLSAVTITVAMNLIAAAALGLAGVAAGQPVVGSFVAGAAVAALGSVFAAIAAVTAQLSSTARGANGLAAAALGVAFVVSGVGNVLGEVDETGLRLVSAWPAWLSPLGWGQQMRPFGGDQWAPLLLFAAAFIVLLAAAAALLTRRDVGSGILAGRRGNAQAAATLLSPEGLVWRLQRGALVGWALSMLGFGLLFGSIIDEITGSSAASTEWYARMGGSEVIVDAFRASIVAMAGMATAIYVVQVLLRLRAEEHDGRVEPVLATSVGRTRWLLAHVLNALVGAVALLLLFALGAAVTAGAVVGDTSAQIVDMTAAALVQLPAILAIGGTTLVLTAVLPRIASPAAWAAVGLWVLIGPMFGAATLRLPQWTQDLSPFTHVPKLPGASFAAMPVVALLALAVALGVAAVVVFRRRDLALPA